MTAVGLAITNVLVGMGRIGAGVGFEAAEETKMEELKSKSQKLQSDVTATGNLYDHVYYLVSENLTRVKKALDKLPSDLLDKVKFEIGAGDADPTAEEAIKVLARVLGAAPSSPVTQCLVSQTAPAASPASESAPRAKASKRRGIFACCVSDVTDNGTQQSQSPSEMKPSEESALGSAVAGEEQEIEMVEIVQLIREQRAEGTEPEASQSDPFENVPLDEEAIPAQPAEMSSFSKAPMLDTIVKGLNIASAVFGVAGLAATIGLAVWTLEKLNKAIDDVEKKQTQVTKFHTAMKNMLDKIATAAGLPKDSYGELTKMAATWKNISQNCDSYEKSFYYAIQGYFMTKSLDEVKELVKKASDPGKPYPDDGYPLASIFADEIKIKFGQNKTDEEIVEFFATENPNIGQRCLLNVFFISTLRKKMHTLGKLEEAVH